MKAREDVVYVVYERVRRTKLSYRSRLMVLFIHIVTISTVRFWKVFTALFVRRLGCLGDVQTVDGIGICFGSTSQVYCYRLSIGAGLNRFSVSTYPYYLLVA